MLSLTNELKFGNRIRIIQKPQVNLEVFLYLIKPTMLTIVQMPSRIIKGQNIISREA